MSEKPELDKVVMTFYQDDEDSAGGSQTLTIQSDDAGAGKYFVIATERWSIDSPEDLTALFSRLRAVFTDEEWGA